MAYNCLASLSNYDFFFAFSFFLVQLFLKLIFGNVKCANFCLRRILASNLESVWSALGFAIAYERFEHLRDTFTSFNSSWRLYFCCSKLTMVDLVSENVFLNCISV